MPGKCLIIGFGSAGKRHARLLRELGCAVALVSARTQQDDSIFDSLEAAFQKGTFDYIVIANNTADHFEALRQVMASGFQGKILVEKPLFDHCRRVSGQTENIYVGYHLRCHPMLEKIAALTAGTPIYAMHAYCGQYLPDWRPDRNYRQVYSAIKALGGGVLRDLSHELDLLLWIGGPWERVAAVQGKFSNLEIDSDDIVSLIMETRHCQSVTLHLNYLDRHPKREITINAEDLSVQADLISNTLWVNGKMEQVQIEKDMPYRSMHQSLLNGQVESLCDFTAGVHVLELIQAAEQASDARKWISRT